MEIQQLPKILNGVIIVLIEHVGTTCTPALKAKLVLGVDITIELSSLEVIGKALVDVAYTDCDEMNVPGRFAFRQAGYQRFEAAHGPGRNGELRHNTYVMIEGCIALKNQFSARKVLIENEELREEYSSVKSNLQIMEFDNIGQHVSVKTEVLCKILRAAGWSGEDLESVISVNN